MCDLAGHWREADLSGLLVRSLLRQRRWCVSPSISGDAPAELLRIRIPPCDIRRRSAEDRGEIGFEFNAEMDQEARDRTRGHRAAHEPGLRLSSGELVEKGDRRA